MISAGALTYGVKHFIGERVEMMIVRMAGERWGNLATMVFYFGLFFTMQARFDNL